MVQCALTLCLPSKTQVIVFTKENMKEKKAKNIDDCGDKFQLINERRTMM